MGKIVVLAEKPSVAREIARVMGATGKRDGYLEGPKYIVTWALGHLVTLAEPEAYGKQYEKWDLETLPMLPKTMQLVVIRETARQFGVVKGLLKNAEELIIATDAGREGELVARWIIEKAGYRKKIMRLWISSQTDRAIREGFAHLRPGSEYENLYQSARARAEADWLVGMNVTRALTCKFNAQLSAGRVQTPTLAMIAAREREIAAFVPKEYYGACAKAGGISLLWRSKTGSPQTFERAAAENAVRACRGKMAKIISLKKDLKREPPPLLYDLTELQRDANKKYGLSAKETLGLMQRLYEEHKLLTYPRTDSRYLSTDVVPTLLERVKSVSVGAYAPAAREVVRRGVRASRRFVDDAKVTDHHAIIPTEQYVDLMSLTADEKRVYDLVVRRFLAVLMSDFVYEQTSVTVEAAHERFTAKGKITKEAGWRAVYDTRAFDEDEPEDGEREQALPQLSQEQSFLIDDVRLTTGKTKPPARYTEATLLTAMEHPAKFIANASLRQAMEAMSGIGTPATRADIIEKLFSSSYVERRGKEIFPLSKGLQLIDIVPEDLKSPELTAKWEQELTLISRGALKSETFIARMREYAARLTNAVKVSGATYRHDNMTRTRCPLCDKFMLEVNGKRGKMLVCQDRECGYRQNLSIQSNARCPKCHKRLDIVGDGEKKLYTCKCGFREKFDRFNEYLKENRAGMSRAQVRDFIARQEEASKSPSPFAAAFEAAKKKQGS